MGNVGFREAQPPCSLAQPNPAIWSRIAGQPFAYLFGQNDPPRRAWRELLSRKDAVTQPAMDRVVAHAEFTRCLVGSKRTLARVGCPLPRAYGALVVAAQ